jgi:UDP-N-acetylglucosamine/UDP-N-acetylgalactosamine diphosphorylase
MILIYQQLYDGWLNRNSFIKSSISPLNHYSQAGNFENQLKGRQLISKGQAGCLLIAGGQGTRLKFDGPKGMFPVTLIKKKSLFQLFAEKTLAAGRQANCVLPLAIMTSPATHEKTVKFFQEHCLFGLKPDQLSFFCQTELPLLDESGNLFLEDKGRMAIGPDGNGSVFKCFMESGIWDQWHSNGVRYLISVLIDNPLADPFDAELVGFHSAVGGDVIVKSTQRLNVEEKVGVLGEKNSKIQVIEYSELSEQEREAKLPDGSLKHPCANLSLFSFTMDFVKAAAQLYNQMPFHLAHKAANYLDSQGVVKHSNQPNAWKFEKFIFDILAFTNKVAILNYPREYCFAPLKNKEGSDSLATVQEALQTLDRLILAQISGKESPSIPFELSQEFYYPTPELLLKWKNKSLLHPGFVNA